MFREDGNVLHFSAPKGTIASFPTLAVQDPAPSREYATDHNIIQSPVHAAVSANTFAVYGTGQVKELTELVPGILNQLGPDSLASLRKLAESYQAIQQNQKRPSAGDEDDDDVPDLVENFDAVNLEEKPAETKEANEANLEDLN